MCLFHMIFITTEATIIILKALAHTVALLISVVREAGAVSAIIVIQFSAS